jgi:hypothetical protein
MGKYGNESPRIRAFTIGVGGRKPNRDAMELWVLECIYGMNAGQVASLADRGCRLMLLPVQKENR